MNSMKVDKYNLIKYAFLSPNYNALTKIRYKDKGTMSKLNVQNDIVNVEFDNALMLLRPDNRPCFMKMKM